MSRHVFRRRQRVLHRWPVSASQGQVSHGRGALYYSVVVETKRCMYPQTIWNIHPFMRQKALAHVHYRIYMVAFRGFWGVARHVWPTFDDFGVYSHAPLSKRPLSASHHRLCAIQQSIPEIITSREEAAKELHLPRQIKLPCSQWVWMWRRATQRGCMSHARPWL